MLCGVQGFKALFFWGASPISKVNSQAGIKMQQASSETKQKLRSERLSAFLDLYSYFKSNNFDFILTEAHHLQGQGRLENKEEQRHGGGNTNNRKSNLSGCRDTGFNFTLCCLTLMVFGKGADLDLRHIQWIGMLAVICHFSFPGPHIPTFDPNDFPAQGELACFVCCCIPQGSEQSLASSRYSINVEWMTITSGVYEIKLAYF